MMGCAAQKYLIGFLRTIIHYLNFLPFDNLTETSPKMQRNILINLLMVKVKEEIVFSHRKHNILVHVEPH